MAQPAPAPGGKGPLGEPRNPSTEGLLSLVTCGLYAYYWIYMRGEELKNHNGEGLGGLVLLLLTLVIVGPFMLAAEVQKMYEADGKQSPVQVLTALWLLLPLVGIFIYVSKVQTALNDYWVSKGAQPVA
jgi:Domain of unknown function (DUF4234)